MADNDDTPPAAAPKPPARRAPRKSAAAKSANTSSDKPATGKSPRKAAAADDAVASAPAKKPAAPPKPRSTKRATPAPKRPAKPKSAPAAAENTKTPVWKNKAAIAGGLAAVGAAATAALLSLRGSTPKKDVVKPGAKSAHATATKDEGAAEPVDTEAQAHMPDGTDASKSFEAGIADENVIPEEK
jgi:hypothetical protein